MKKSTVFMAILFWLVFTAQAGAGPNPGTSKYAGQEKRAIKSLSEADIADLLRGAGWGMAKAAELNGVPGPAHLLEMKNQIPLDANQVLAINEIYLSMKSEAILYGRRLIEAERSLEKHFRDRTINAFVLKKSLNKIADVRMQLRHAHLAAHLKTPKILSESQIQNYNRLRGYLLANPCDSIPKGHSAKMWRKHNGCK